MMTMEGTIMGTPAFMPPEQAKGELEHLDWSSDIYLLGGILYNILTLHPPVEADNINYLLLKVVRGEILSPASYNSTTGSIKKNDPEQKQKFTDALKTIDAAINLEPKSRFYCIKGNILQTTFNLKEAEKAYSNALKLNKNNKSANNKYFSDLKQSAVDFWKKWDVEKTKEAGKK